MGQINWFAISGITIILAYLPLYFLLISKWENKLVRIYSFHILVTMCWGLFSFLLGITQNQALSFLLWAFSFIPVLFIPVFFLHSTIILINRENKILLIGAYLQATFFAIASLSGELFSGTVLSFNQFYCPKPKTIYYIAVFFWLP